MVVHEIKSWPDSFGPLIDGTKTFELRYNDRNYATGDMLHLREWNPETQEYTGREARTEVLGLWRGGLNHFAQLDPGWVIMSINVPVVAEGDAAASLWPRGDVKFTALEFNGEMSTLTLGPKDILVVKVRGTISSETAAHIRSDMRRIMDSAGLENTVAVIDENISLGVVRVEDRQ